MLYAGLSASARTHFAEQGGWSITDHLLARLIEETNLVYRGVWATVPRKPGTRPPEPLRLPRPGPKPKPRKVTPLEFMRMATGVADG